jgi:glutamine amidotransferase
MKVAIVNYGMGNLASVKRVLEELGAEPFVAEGPASLADADRVVLPGVGAFPAAMHSLTHQGWRDALQYVTVERRKPLLGICLGMQLLASRGEEGQPTDGLGFIDGTVRRLDAIGCALRIPHVGWNQITHVNDDPMFARIPQESDFYFVHSFAFAPEAADSVVAFTDYGAPVVAAVRKQNIWGVQFHPEKSSRAGRQLLQNFLDYASC